MLVVDEMGKPALPLTALDGWFDKENGNRREKI